MGWSWKWHDLRSPISKKNPRYANRELNTYVRIAHCEFQRVLIFYVSLTGSQTSKMQLEVRSLNVAWRRDLWGQEVTIFRQCVKELNEKLWQIWRCYAPPFFRYPQKPEGADNRPHGRARVKRTPPQRYCFIAFVDVHLSVKCFSDSGDATGFSSTPAKPEFDGRCH